MRQISFLIVSLLTIAATSAKEVTRIVGCGDKVTIAARPIKGFRFVRWNDDSTDSLRTIEIYQDAIYTAFFVPSCNDGNNALPLVNRYDWILMLNVRQIIQEMHYDISPERVHWYCAVGKVDNLDGVEENDPEDTYLGEGYSFTIDKNLQQTGVYYAVAELNNNVNIFCSGMVRSELAYFVAPEPARQIRLLPNTTTPNGTMRLLGLNPQIATEIRVYSVTGQLLLETSSVGAEEYLLSAYPSTGVFEVQVLSEEDNVVLRYLVKQ